MAAFPLVCNFQGDYGMKILMADSGDTMDIVAQKARDALVGVVVKAPRPGTVLRVRRHHTEEFLPGDLTIEKAQFVKLEAVDIIPTTA